MNKQMLIIFAVFALIISCKNFATGKDIKQNSEGKIKGFLDKILDPAKDRITSSGLKADEVAKKLQEEEKNELMQGDDPNNGVISPPPALPASGQDNAPGLKVEQQSGGQQEEQAKVGKEDKGEGEKVEVRIRKEKEENKEGNAKEKEEGEKQKAKAKEEAKQKAERLKREEEQKRKEIEIRQEERQLNNQIGTLVSKIDEINRSIDTIKQQTSVGAQGIIDRITGPIYDDFTDDTNQAIYHIWDLEEEDSELGKLLEELSDTRDALRTKLNVDNQAYLADSKEEPSLKENVKVSEINSELTDLKSKLEEVKKYLEDESNFEEIKGYIEGSNSY
ncbi:ErpC protein (plasmid) [Borreliella mayonii]|uniref:ErpC protein n=1 Tax=Borreliella mayonii TaxID=1674146 RepID=A0AAC9KUM4_9SPIR|nr:ErpC protein [Borreliella mayonii]APS99102.1 ErpC protein [Borreliella mayonii]APT00222.1 ErpC protein [Borreliella mayonii]